MDLKIFALKLKKELIDNPSIITAKNIALKIEKATHADGSKLSDEEISHILKYIEYPNYDHKSGRIALQHADNSEFLKLVAVVTNSIRENKKEK